MAEMELELQLLEMLRTKQLKKLRENLDALEPADIAEMMETLLDDSEITKEDLPVMFRVLSKDIAADTFVEMNPEMQQTLIKAFTDKELHDVMDDMFVDDMVDVIEEMPANVVQRMLKAVDPDTRKDINTILKYPEDSAGSIMTTEYIDLHPDMTVKESFDKIRKVGEEVETINVCYVTDKHKLVGLLSVRDLLLNPYEAQIESIMETDIISVTTTDDREEVANLLSRYDYYALPVVDAENRMVGIVTVDDAIDVLTEEATEDIEKMAAMVASEKPYLRESVWGIFKQRFPWLALLMVSATFTGIIITQFEDALAVQAALTAFIPMLMGTGGNCGSQSSVTIIRGISLGEIEFSDFFQVFWKELRVSVVCGVCLGALSFAKIMLVDGLLFGNEDITVMISLVVSLALMGTVILAKLVGGVLPLIAKKLGADPAVMASPFITTIVDALSLLIYMNVATSILGL